MTTILLVIQVFIVVSLIAIIMLQKTGTDSLAGLSGGGNGVMSSKSSANVFTKITFYLAIAFIINSLIIAKVSRDNYLKSTSSIIQSIENQPAQHLPLEQKAPVVEE